MEQLLQVLLWYLLLAVLAFLALPIAYRFLPALPERGYAFLRPLGLLLWGFLFWMLGSFGLLANDAAGLLTALLLAGGLSLWAWRSLPAGELAAWLRTQRATLLGTELVFALAFAFMLYIRANIPQIAGTEKPMELAFINAILHSPSLPPHDPWLSGFSISYYYFGYLMVAMLAKLLGVAGAVAFNIGVAMIFAMAATAAYGLLFNLLALYQPQLRRSLYWLAALATLFMLLLGNAEGLLELMHARHLFWSADAAGQQSSGFWAWMDIKDLVNPPAGEPSWAPRNYNTDYWWWWRASRVINDRTYSGGEQELIDEFPAFSFTLGDLHPHVLSMPFVLLATGLALNVYLGGAERKQALPLGLRLREEQLALAALVIGSLAFLNIWDLPIYAILYAGAYVLHRAQQQGWRAELIEEFLGVVFIVGLGGVALFLPFYLGFTSQAAGILPNLLNPTRGTHFGVMFITLLAPIVLYAIWQWWGRGGRLLKALLIGLGFVFALWAFSFGLAWLYTNLLLGSELGQAVAVGLGAPDVPALFAESLSRRLGAAGGWLSIAALLGLFGGLLAAPKPAQKSQLAPTQARAFVWLLALVAALLVTAPEFIYLRDQFGTRMNTVFKFYIQAWLMWSVVASFAVVALLAELRGAARTAVSVVLALVLGAGLVYPLYAFTDVGTRPEGRPLTLDGSAILGEDALAAVAWLQQAEPGVLVEAVGGSYSGFARYATFSGQPGVMGWPGHEGQWRGGNVDYERIDEIKMLYITPNWDMAQVILDKYGITYVIVGDLERSAYAVSEGKFEARLQLVFQSGQVNIYRVP